MDESISHSGNLAPLNTRLHRLDIFRKFFCCLTDNLEASNKCPLERGVSEKGIKVSVRNLRQDEVDLV